MKSMKLPALPVYLDTLTKLRPWGWLLHAYFIFPFNPFSLNRRHKQ